MALIKEYQFKSTEYCKICGNICTPFDVVDFNKSCEEAKGKFLALSGMPVYYFRCRNCGFLFAPMFDTWSVDEFKQKIYNDEYESVDPDYKELRPKSNAMFLEQLFGSFKNDINHIDYGGGNGLLSSTLTTLGWKSGSYDPIINIDTDIRSYGKFQLVTAFEVLEHSPDPNKLMKDLETLIVDNGLILFSTLLSDGLVEQNNRLNWWYAAPRNGHISLYSKNSLTLLFGNRGFQTASFSPVAHIALKQIPSWAKHIFK